VEGDTDLGRRVAAFRQPCREQALLDVAVAVAIAPVAEVAVAQLVAEQGDDTVLRGAFTISSYLEGTGTNLRLPLNAPFSPAEFLTQYQNVALPGTTASDGIIPPPPSGTGSSCLVDLACYKGVLFRIWDSNVQPAISDQWNLTAQHQFGWNTTLQVGYVGQRTTHLMVPMPYLQERLLPNGIA
jgi:hypothetical protein